jgi:hypothetical protein
MFHQFADIADKLFALMALNQQRVIRRCRYEQDIDHLIAGHPHGHPGLQVTQTATV